ncbi:hypothetical protein [Alienimonas californiensis]|nr:hypothetical protein [Alienimonas californiensis]
MDPADPHADDDRPLTPFARLRRPAFVLAEGVAVVLAAIAVTLILLPGLGGADATAAVTAGRPGDHALSRFLTLVRVEHGLPTSGLGGARLWEYEDGLIGVRLASLRGSPFGDRHGTRTTAATVPVWLLLGAGLAIGAVRLWWTYHTAPRPPGPSPRRRLAVRIGRAWLWSAALLGAALVVAPHPDHSGWAAGLWVENWRDPLAAERTPRVFWGADAIDEFTVLPWRWLLAAPALGTAAVFALFVGSSCPATGEESHDAPPAGG